MSMKTKKEYESKLFLIKHLTVVLSVVLLSIQTKSYKNITKYYKNFTYASLFNLLYYVLCRRKLMWSFTPFGIHWKLIRIGQTLIVIPLLVLSFLTNSPKSVLKQIRHLLKWVILTTLVEFLFHKQKLIMYKHGWNIYWSGTVYLLMFSFSKMYSIRPKLTWFLSLFSIAIYVKLFKIPLRKKHVSRKFEWFVDLFYHSVPEDLF